jgi:outer membrane protein TolC
VKELKLWNKIPGELFNMKKIFYVLLVLGLTANTLLAQQVEKKNLNLNKAVSLTINNYPLIKQAEKNVEVADAKIKVQESFDFPVVRAEASYTRIGPVPSIGLPGAGSFELATPNNYDAHVGAFYNLYDFGKKDAQMDFVRSYKKSATDNIDLVKSNLAFATVQTYYSILFIEQGLAVNDTDAATLNQHIDITNRKIESGTATDYDLLSTKVRLADYQSNKVALQNQLNNQKIVLQHLTGLPNKDQIKVSGNFSLLTTSVNIDSLVNVAYRQRPEIKLALDQENTAMLKKSVVAHGDLPDVNVSFNYGLKNGFEPNLDVLRGNWAATVGVSVPIFNGFRTRNQEEEANAGIDVSKINTINIKQKIAAEVQKAAENVESNLLQIQTAELKINLAEQVVQKARAQYASGVGTNLDLLDAETKLADARFLYLRTTYENIMQTYELKKAVGDIIW